MKGTFYDALEKKLFCGDFKIDPSKNKMKTKNYTSGLALKTFPEKWTDYPSVFVIEDARFSLANKSKPTFIEVYSDIMHRGNYTFGLVFKLFLDGGLSGVPKNQKRLINTKQEAFIQL